MIKIDKLNPFGRLCITLGMIPTSYKESLTYEEQLLWLFNFIEKTLIPTINNNAQAVEELQALYLELKSYVDNYFTNLDIQQEINNKLDQMAQSGELEAIIGQYLSLAGILSYNTVADLKAAQYLIDGSICSTLGFYSINDGGSASYKIRTITNEDVIDNMTIIPLTNSETLIAELIVPDTIVPQILGARANSSYDDTLVLNKAFEIAGNKKAAIQLKGQYYIKSPLTINNQTSVVCYGSKATIGTLLQEQNNSFSNLIFTNTGYIEITGVTNVTFQNICFSGTNKAIIFKSFRNRLLNCSFNGFDTAISVEEGTNWNGENKIVDCTFNSVTKCIVLNSGSDGDITGCLVDSKCTSFITGGFDSGYKIENNHDYSQTGSIINGNNTQLIGNYIDGFDKLVISGNGGFTILGNQFLGVAPESGTHKAITFTNQNSVISGTITGNSLICNNNDNTNEYLYFLDISAPSYFSYVSISGNNIRIAKATFLGGSVQKIYNCNIEQATQLNIFVVNNKATISSSYGVLSNNKATYHVILTLNSLNTAEVVRYENMFSHWLHIIKMNNEDSYRIEFSDSRSVYARGSYAQATSMEVWSFGLNEKTGIPFDFIPS